MKQSYIFCVICLVLLLFGGCGNQQNGMTYIGADEAKQLVLDNFGESAAEVKTITANLVTYNGRDCYQVNITMTEQNYQYIIDVITGKIVGSSGSITTSWRPSAESMDSNPTAQAVPNQTTTEDISEYSLEADPSENN